MLQAETSVINHLEAYQLDQRVDQQCQLTNHLNEQHMTTKSFGSQDRANKQPVTWVNKSYEVQNNIIQESYFELDGFENSQEFMSDYAATYPKGIILVINNKNRTQEINLLTNSLNSNLKHIITCKSESESNSNIENNHLNIESDNLGNAVLTAHSLATDGQVILFQGVNKNFDFMSYL